MGDMADFSDYSDRIFDEDYEESEYLNYKFCKRGIFHWQSLQESLENDNLF